MHLLRQMNGSLLEMLGHLAYGRGRVGEETSCRSNYVVTRLAGCEDSF